MTEETKHEKFLRLSAARVDRAKHALKQIEYLGSANYEFSKAEANALLGELQEAVDVVAVAIGAEAPDPEVLPPQKPTLEPLDLTLEERRELHRVAPQIDAAINEITDGNPEAAKALLLNLMRS